MKVLFIDIDSTRADQVGCYGQEAPTTPNIDAIAEDGVWFEQGYVANSPCMPSRAALHSGRYGLNNGVNTHGARAQTINGPHTWEDFDGNSSEWRFLPEVFFDERVQTMAVSSFPRHPSPWFYHVWDEFVQPRERTTGKYEYFQTPRAEDVADLSIDRIDPDEDWYLYTQYWDPHSPYLRSEDEVEAFRGYEIPAAPTDEQIAEHLEWNRFRDAADSFTAEALRYSDHDAITDREALGELYAHYRAEIAYLDQQIGRVIDHLKTEGIYDETLIVISADHGEEFGEHGLYREHWSVHDGTQRVPFIIKPPASQPVEQGPRDQLVTNVDLGPTMVDYAGFEIPGAWQGESLRPVVEDRSTDWRDAIVFDHGLYTAQRAVRTDRWKFIRTYHPGDWPDVAPPRQLYDMEADPHEQDDVSEEHPELLEELETTMAVWAETHVGRDEDELKRTAREGPSAIN